MPAALEINWQEVQLFCVAGHSYREAGDKFDVDEATVRQRSHREQWPVPERVSRIVTRVADNEALAVKMAETWAEKGESHRAIAFKVAQKAMTAISAAPPEVKDWADVEKIDKLARRAAGLDTSEATVSNSFNFTMLGERMEVEAPVIEIPAQDVGDLPE